MIITAPFFIMYHYSVRWNSNRTIAVFVLLSHSVCDVCMVILANGVYGYRQGTLKGNFYLDLIIIACWIQYYIGKLLWKETNMICLRWMFYTEYRIYREYTLIYPNNILSGAIQKLKLSKSFRLSLFFSS